MHHPLAVEEYTEKNVFNQKGLKPSQKNHTQMSKHHRAFLNSRNPKESLTRIYIRRNSCAHAGKESSNGISSRISSNVLLLNQATIKISTVP